MVYSSEPPLVVFTSSDPCPIKSETTNKRKRRFSFMDNSLITGGKIYSRYGKNAISYILRILIQRNNDSPKSQPNKQQ
jgi:hypothetical protein